MIKKLLFAVMAIGCSLTAVAGFIDGRTEKDGAQKVAPASVSAPLVAPVTGVNTNSSESGGAASQVKKTEVREPWTVSLRDNTISNVLNRWAFTGGYQIVWQAEKDLPSYPAVYTGSFEDAVETLMGDTKHSGYPLHACLYDNRVLRVVHVTQSCGK